MRISINAATIQCNVYVEICLKSVKVQVLVSLLLLQSVCDNKVSIYKFYVSIYISLN